MAALETLQVFQALNRSPNARLEHSAELGDGMAAALWSNHHDAQDLRSAEPSHPVLLHRRRHRHLSPRPTRHQGRPRQAVHPAGRASIGLGDQRRYSPGPCVFQSRTIRPRLRYFAGPRTSRAAVARSHLSGRPGASPALSANAQHSTGTNPANACSPAAWPMKCSATYCSARLECVRACD